MSYTIAWKKARKGKTKKNYVIEFEKYLERNLLDLQFELKNQFYEPLPLKTFILRDPKTRKISKSDFRDRVIHHAIVNILEPIFDRTFIHDSCANRKGKGNLFALKRFYKFVRKVSRNGKLKGTLNNNQVKGYCLKADIKHYFQEVNHKTLLKIISRKISDEKVWQLIEKIVEPNNERRERETNETFNSKELNGLEISNLQKGMPLGNLTSQFFANIYLNELDYFVKHKLRAKFYIRYVDDFVILHNLRERLEIWKKQIDNFLNEKLILELHKEKSKIVPLSEGIDFVGFRNFYYFKLLRKRNIRKMFSKVNKFKGKKLNYKQITEIFQGWNAYAKWANTFKLRKETWKRIAKLKQ